MYVEYCSDINTNDELTIKQERILESVSINIKLKFHMMLCGTLYRSSTNDAKDNDSFLRT